MTTSTSLSIICYRCRPAFVRHLRNYVVSAAMVIVGYAHGDLDVQIRLASEQIAAAPTASLFLKRANLYHQHEDYPAALEDYEAALRLDPTLETISLARGRTFFASGRFADARIALDTFLAHAPTNAEGFLLRARVRFSLHDDAGAVLDFSRHLAVVDEPRPETYLAYSAALKSAHGTLAALGALDAGIERIGNLVTLQSAAIALELELGRPDAALARIDCVIARLDRTEAWLARRAEILDTAGRPEDARQEYRRALAAIEKLPASHRNAPPVGHLEAQLRAKLLR